MDYSLVTQSELDILRGEHNGKSNPPLDQWYEVARVVVVQDANLLLAPLRSLVVYGRLRVMKDMLRYGKLP